MERTGKTKDDENRSEILKLLSRRTALSVYATQQQQPQQQRSTRADQLIVTWCRRWERLRQQGCVDRPRWQWKKQRRRRRLRFRNNCPPPSAPAMPSVQSAFRRGLRLRLRLVSSCVLSRPLLSSFVVLSPEPASLVLPRRRATAVCACRAAKQEEEEATRSPSVHAPTSVWGDGVILMRYGIEVCVRELVG